MPTYPEAMSTIAVFIALGGTSYAVARNSVGTPQLRDSAVNGAKIRDGSVDVADLTERARATRGPRGAAGPQGPAGAQGAPGAAGAGEVVQAVRPNGVSVSSSAGGSATVATVTVPAGTWNMHGATNLRYDPSTPGSEWFTCTLRTATGQSLASGTVRVGTDTQAVIIAPITAHRTVTFAGTTEIAYVCSHPSPINTPAAEANQSVLTAARVERVVDQ